MVSIESCRSPGLCVLVVFFLFFLSCTTNRDPLSLYARAWQDFQHGDLTNARKEAEEGYKRTGASDPELSWKFTILRGRIAYEQGGYQQTLTLLASAVGTPPSGELAIRKSWLEGFALTSLHRFTEAEEKFLQAESLCGKAELAVPCTDVASARGRLEMERGHFEEAHAFFERVLSFARQRGDDLWEADALLDLSWADDEKTHFDEALDRAAAAYRIATAKKVPDVAQKALGNMAWAYYKLGDLEKAEEMFTAAKDQSRQLGEMSSEAGWILDLGHVFMDERNYDAAENAFRRSLDLSHKINSREDSVNSLIALALVSEQTNHLNDAGRYADESLRLARADGNKRDETYPRLVQGRIAARQHDAASAEAAFHEVESSLDAPVFLKWEAQRSLARLYEDKNDADAAAREYRTALSTFESARSELQHENSRLPFLTNASHIYDDYIHLLVAQGKTDEALQVADYSRARTLSEGLGVLKSSTSFRPDPLNAREIARRVGGSIFFYWLGEKQSYLWLITAQKTTLFPLPPASDIEPAVQRYRKALVGPQDPLAIQNSDGLALYRMLVAPAQGQLPKNARVFIIPDGSLNTLNFETLLAPEPTPHYWIEDVTTIDASSLRLLGASRRTSSTTGKLLLLGNSPAPSEDYPELRKAADEMNVIGEHFAVGQQQVFSGEQATPTAYVGSKPEQYSYIHFVAHGTASRMSPLDSAIVLSRASAQDDSFKLYAREIIQHPLRADLVTISTCYGAGSRAYSGEGLVGLSWAFLRAGAHHVIGALWEVSDVSTPQLMDEVYRGLKEGKSPDAALRAAKLTMLHSGNAFRKPFYWAPFQLYTGS